MIQVPETMHFFHLESLWEVRGKNSSFLRLTLKVEPKVTQNPILKLFTKTVKDIIETMNSNDCPGFSS